MALPTLNQFIPVLLEALPQILRLSASRGVSCGHGHVDRRQSMLVQPKGFSREPLDAVAGHRGAERARGYRQPKARTACLIPENRQTEKRIGQTPAALTNGPKFGRTVQALARLEPQPLVKRRCRYRIRVGRQGQSFLRPLARRRASTRRPLLVAMRARKPCVRARCKLLGLNVRFIAQLQETQGTNRRTYDFRERRQGYLGWVDVSIDALLTWG